MNSENKNILIYAVEDDPVFSRLLEYTLSMDDENEVVLYDKGLDLLNNIHKKPDIITLDYTLPDMTGEDLMRRIKLKYPKLPVIVISGQDEVKAAVEMFKIGVYDYITKDEDIKERLLNSVNNLKLRISMQEELDMLREELSNKYDFSKTIVGNSEPIKKVFGSILKTANNNLNVSVTGETGTGKELVAKAIHYNSVRKSRSFVPVNIAAIPEQLLESELFGHEKGAFTGAVSRRIGKFEEAHGGTIFLDEIGEMDINLQAKLLRVIQERELVRIGSNSPVKLDVRIITATHKNLLDEVKQGNFREDLYYRLLGLPIELPPLRERGNDILLISRKIIDDFTQENNLEKISMTKEAGKKLLSYHFPGNVRELKAVIELASVLCTDNLIDVDDIQFNQGDEPLEGELTQEMTLKEYTFNIVQRYMDKYDQNVLYVADKLGVGKSTIYRYLKEMEEDTPREKKKRKLLK